MRGIGILIFLFTCTMLSAQNKEALGYKNLYFLEVTFDEIPNKSKLNELQSQNIELTSYIGDNRYKVVMPKSVDLSALDTYGITSHSHQKRDNNLSLLIEEGKIPAHAKVGANLEVAIVLNIKLTEDNLNSFISEMELKVKGIYSKGQILEVTTDTNTIEKLSNHPLVSYLNFKTPELKPLNFDVAALHGAKYAASGLHGTSLEGEGIVIGIGDGGSLGEHIDLGVGHINEAEGTYSNFGSHGDHVSGTIAGKGFLNPLHKGIAPQSTLVIQQTQNIIYNAEDYYDQYDMVLTNNSYGVQFDCEYNGAYNYSSSNLDKQLRRTPELLHLFAAGNSGTNTCGGYPQGFHTVLKFYGAAKNVLTIGAVDENKELSPMSSRGPVADGRIKPEIVGVGVDVVSTGRDNDYFTSSGTSMATPAVTGCMALMYERYEQINGKQPYGDLMKAIICNTAEDLGRSGPDYEYGFGMANLVNALESIDEKQYFVDEIDNNEEVIKELNVPAGLDELKIMNYWHDHEAEAYPNVALINNLDLMVEDPNGQKFYPLVLNSDSIKVDEPAKQGIDNLNNIEQIVISDPKPGVYKLYVKGKSVPFGGQRFNLVYDFLKDEIELVYPAGKESLIPGNEYPISWSDNGSSNGFYKVDFSIDGGINWHVIAQGVPALRTNVIWKVPETVTSAGHVRITKSGKLASNIIPFNILPRPANIQVVPLCEDIVSLIWDEQGEIDSYEVFQFENGEMVSKGKTESNRIEVEGAFELYETYWFAVQGIHSSGERTERSVAISAKYDEMNTCPREKDMKLTEVSGIMTGRALTKESLTQEEHLKLTIKNIGREDLLDFKFHVLLNDEIHVEEEFQSVLYSGMELNYPFSHDFDLTSAGTYSFDAWVSSDEDHFLENDSLIGTFEVEQLPNEPITLPYQESFDADEEIFIHSSSIGMKDFEKWDFINEGSEINYASVEMNGGNYSLNLNNYENKTSQTMLTLNTSSFTIDQQIFLTFKYKFDQAADVSAQVYLRGNDADEWIHVSELEESGDWEKINNYNITSALLNAQQLFSTSTQIKFVLIGEGQLSIDDLLFENVPLDVFDLLQEHVEVYPNPFSDRINVTLNNEYGKEAAFQLYDATGIEKMTESNYLQDGLNFFNFDLDKSLPVGIYFLKIQVGSYQIIRKISKNLN